MKKTIFIALILILVLGIFGLIEFIRIVRDLPHPEKIDNFQTVQSTKIYDRTGEILLYEIYNEQNRTVVPFADIPDYFKKAVISAEDQNFYQHSALDWKGTIRAVLVNLSQGNFTKNSFSQGGSTITQQLVKNVFLTPEKTIERKIKEWVLSYWLENNYSKDQILDFYLNQIPFGSNAYGVESASQLFFGKQTKNLSLAESALLASLIQTPSYYSPWGDHVEELMDKKDNLLEKMNKLGYINQEQLKQAREEEIKFLAQSIGSIRAPHFVMMVKDYLIDKYGEEAVERGGLKVVTTLDWPKQEIAERVVKEGAERNAELYKGKNAAMVVEDPKTGQILSLVGSADYFDESIDGNFNVAYQGLRQPGSTFKPFAYLEAFLKGYTPETIVFDVPTEFSSSPNCSPVVNFSIKDSKCFHPQNFDGIFRGPVSLKQGLAQSINVPSVKTLYLAGLDDTIDLAEKLGITTLKDRSRYGLSLVLGGGEVKLTELVGAYSVFAQDGAQHAQNFILSVENYKGETLEKFSDQAVQIIEPQYIRMINAILSDIDLRSGLFHSSLSYTIFDGYEVALKTGTTNDYKDAWVVGYTPSLVVGVWAGNSNNTPMQQQGGSILAAIPMWSSFLNQVIKEYPSENFSRPEAVSLSRPMLNGQYINEIQRNGVISKHIHNLLYYIDKNNPLNNIEFGSTISNESQFNNWEIPVIEWAKTNIPNFLSDFNKN